MNKPSPDDPISRNQRETTILRSGKSFYFLVLEWHRRGTNQEHKETMERFFQQCVSFFFDRQGNHHDDLFIEFSLLTDGLYAIAISGYWPDHKGPGLPDEVLHCCEIGTDSGSTAVRKVEYLRLVAESLKSVTID